MKRTALWIAVLTCGIVLEIGTGCCTTTQPPQVHLSQSPGADWIRTELFFGLSKRDGSVVSAEEWSMFLDESILPRFPDGLTVVDANGRYRDEKFYIYKEPSKIVILLYPPDKASYANEMLAALITEYCTKFEQESVLRVDSMGKANLIFGKKK